jgi:hypothetical protein
MDRRERRGDLDVAVLAAIQGNQAGLWTAMPGIIRTYEASKQTASVEVSIKMQIQEPDGAWRWEAIKPLVDCPILFPSGGGYTLTFPVLPGDECLVVFASRCIDSWWQSGGVQIQADLRLHDLSDGFVLPGPRSQPRMLSPAPSTSGIELRNDARTAYVRIDGAGNVLVTAAGDLVASVGGSAQVTAPTISLTGNVTVNGNLTVNGNTALTGTARANGKDIGSTHTHSGVQTGSGNTGAPNT